MGNVACRNTISKMHAEVEIPVKRDKQDPKELQEMSSKLQDTPHHMTNGYTQPQDTNGKSSTNSSKSLISRTSYTSVCSNGFCQLSEGFGCGRCRVQSEGEESNHECINTANRATLQLKDIILQLDRDQSLDQTQIKHKLLSVVDMLSSISQPVNEGYSDSQLERLVEHEEVRAWLTSTFTKSESKTFHRERKPTFKAVVGTIMAGQYIGKMWEAHHVTYPTDVEEFLNDELSTWNCDIFRLELLTNLQPLKYIGHELFERYGLSERFKISANTLDVFLTCVEKGYKLHDNPYHNSTHAADVTQTVHYFIETAGLKEWLSSVELLSLIFSAIIHDVEHTGKTNNFHIQSYSKLALCYNDYSVQENYHLYRAFCVLKEENHNILRSLTEEEFHEFRKLSVNMVLGTDMSKHFDKLKEVKKILASPNPWDQIKNDKKPKVLSLLLHTADVSHPGKKWDLHEQWTMRLIEEFFRQGDREKELGLNCSPLCDRNLTAIPESQIGFSDVILRPLYDVCGDVLELATKMIAQDDSDGECVKCDLRVWNEYLNNNKKMWKLKCKSKATNETSSDTHDDEDKQEEKI